MQLLKTTIYCSYFFLFAWFVSYKFKLYPVACTGGYKYEKYSNLREKFNAHLTKTHIPTKHLNIMSVAVMYFIFPIFFFLAEWQMLECCYFFLKRSENILQLTDDDVNFLSKQNMQMNCVNTIKSNRSTEVEEVHSGQSGFQARAITQPVTSPDFVSIYLPVTNNCRWKKKKRTIPGVRSELMCEQILISSNSVGGTAKQIHPILHLMFNTPPDVNFMHILQHFYIRILLIFIFILTQ